MDIINRIENSYSELADITNLLADAAEEIRKSARDRENVFKAFADACNPNKTEGLYTGQFFVEIEGGRQCIYVDWKTIRSIQTAIFEKALLNMGWKCAYCGSTRHSLDSKDGSPWPCCGYREEGLRPLGLVPPECKIMSETEEDV